MGASIKPGLAAREANSLLGLLSVWLNSNFSALLLAPAVLLIDFQDNIYFSRFFFVYLLFYFDLGAQSKGYSNSCRALVDLGGLYRMWGSKQGWLLQGKGTVRSTIYHSDSFVLSFFFFLMGEWERFYI